VRQCPSGASGEIELDGIRRVFSGTTVAIVVLGVDRDSELLASEFDERNPAVLHAIGQVIAAARRAGRKVGICGQAPSDHPEMVRFLVERGITSILLNPDSVVGGLDLVAAAEADLVRRKGV